MKKNDGAGNGKGGLKVKNKFEKPNSAPVPIMSAHKNWPLQNKCPLDIQTPAEKVLGPPKHTQNTFWWCIWMSRGRSYHLHPLTKWQKIKKKNTWLQSPQKLYGQGAIQHDPFGMCIRNLSQITHHLEPAWELGNHRQGAGGKQKTKKMLRE